MQEGFAFFGFLAPIVSGLFGSTTAGALATAALGVGGQLIAAKQQRQAAQSERAANAEAEAKSRAAYRDQLRVGSIGRGSGDFAGRLGAGGGFSAQLKSLTGQ